MLNFIEKFLSLPKSLYVSFRLFPFNEAIKCPCLVRYNTKLISLDGTIKVKWGGVKPFMFYVGFGQVGIFDKTYERTVLQINGVVELDGKVYLGQGCRLSVANNAVVHFGKSFVNTATMTLVCSNSVFFGEDCTVAWNTLIMDTDWHQTIDVVNNKVKPCSKPIHVGCRTWIGTRAIVLKGAHIPDGCIIGAGAIITQKFDKENACIVGNPARIVKENITMQRKN